jgi:thiamine pyrophosphokinase
MRYSLICAADSGLETAAAWGLVPDLIVGDMDSLADSGMLASYPHAEILRYPVRKDETDTELAIIEVRKRTECGIVLAGGGGGRLDHLLAIRSIFERDLRPEAWYTSGDEVFLVREGREFRREAGPGERVSVFPLACGAREMWSEGLRWPLGGLVWGAGDFGISNECVDRSFAVRAGRGELLVILSSLCPSDIAGRTHP